MTKRIGVYVGSSVLVCLGLSVAVRGQRSGQSPYSWVAAASMHSPRAGACSVALRDGRVLMSGGSNESGVLSTAEILDADGKFLSVTPMSTARVVFHDGIAGWQVADRGWFGRFHRSRFG